MVLWRKYLPRLRVAQIPNFVPSIHTYGQFNVIRTQDPQSAIQEWEKGEAKGLCRYEALLGQVIDIVKEQAGGRCEVICEESADVS